MLLLVTCRGAVRVPVAAALAAALLATAESAPAAKPEQARSTERAGSLPKVEFPTSAVHELPSVSGRRYQLWVDLPAARAGVIECGRHNRSVLTPPPPHGLATAFRSKAVGQLSGDLNP